MLSFLVKAKKTETDFHTANIQPSIEVNKKKCDSYDYLDISSNTKIKEEHDKFYKTVQESLNKLLSVVNHHSSKLSGKVILNKSTASHGSTFNEQTEKRAATSNGKQIQKIKTGVNVYFVTPFTLQVKFEKFDSVFSNL